MHAFEYACAQNDIEGRMARASGCSAIKDAAIKLSFYEIHDQLRTRLRDFVDACNFARRLKPPDASSPDEFICKAWTSKRP
jgi:hypothetical protein